MSNRLEGKSIIVVGAGGIGNELARRYAREGASVILGNIHDEIAKTTADEIVAAGGKAIGIALDGADEGAIKAAVDLAVSTYGGLDGIHINFANFRDGDAGSDVLELPIDIYDDVMRVNARGFLLCSRYALPPMLARGGGSIVYTSSGAAHMGLAERVVYSMSKASTHALMRHVATRFGPEGIRANVIAPGLITHARFEEMFSAEMASQMAQTIPVRRLGTSVDIAAMGALLMSDEGSFINGQVISVDGGSSMRP